MDEVSTTGRVGLPRHSILIVSASMGAGHDGVARELARRFRSRGDSARVVDFLELLPPPVGDGLRALYAAMLRRAPLAYEATYRVFLKGRGAVVASGGPSVVLALSALRRLVADMQPDVVVSTFHLAAAAVARLRREGSLHAETVTYVTDFARHALWVQPGTDAYLCVEHGMAAWLAARTTAHVVATGPVVSPGFAAATPARGAEVRARLGIPADASVVLLGGGSWGVGDVLGTAREIEAGGWLPLVLCGRDEGLLQRVSHSGVGVALGWTADMPGVFAAADLLVDNAGGLTSMEALAAGLPVVTYRPIPGHGAENVRRMAASGVSLPAQNASELVDALGAAAPEGPVRRRLVEAGRSLFRHDAAAVIRRTADLVPAGALGCRRTSSGISLLDPLAVASAR